MEHRSPSTSERRHQMELARIRRAREIRRAKRQPIVTAILVTVAVMAASIALAAWQLANGLS